MNMNGLNHVKKKFEIGNFLVVIIKKNLLLNKIDEIFHKINCESIMYMCSMCKCCSKRVNEKKTCKSSHFESAFQNIQIQAQWFLLLLNTKF